MIPDCYDNYIAKSDPELTLREHTQDVVDEAQSLLDALQYESKYFHMTGLDLRELLLEAAVFHDAGKMAPIWQKKCRQDDLREVGFRHEMASVQCVREASWGRPLLPVQTAAILAHHSKLSEFHQSRWTDDRYSFEGLWNEMKSLSQKTNPSGQTSLEGAVRQRYRFSVLRGLLKLADERASQREGHGPDPRPVKPFDYQFPTEWDLREVQKAALDLAEHRQSALRAQTGSGKTAGSLLWAQRQIEEGNARRVVMALPTQFTSTSLRDDVAGQVSAGLYHGSAWSEIKDEEQASDAHQDAARFVDPCTVCTIDQVLMALTGQSEDHHIRFANLAHSALVVDEIDAYSDDVQANMQVLMKALKTLDVPVLTMSATLPSEHITFFGDNVVFKDKTQPGSAFELASSEKLESPSDVPAEWLTADRCIIYANTVSRAVQYYQAASSVRDDVVLHHSRFIEPDRRRNEARILEMLGEDGDGGLAVMTQVGEMSLNVSADVMVSELCPIDRLAQRTGRMARFIEQTGKLYLVIPQDDGALYPAPYGQWTGKGWAAAQELTDTAEILSVGSVYDKTDLRDLTEEVYTSEPTISQEAEDNARAYITDEITKNWLIVPKYEADPGDVQSFDWETRLIPPQIEVFCKEPQPYYEDETELRQDRRRKAVSLRAYRQDEVQQVSVKIGSEQQTVFFSPRYSQEIGLP